MKINLLSICFILFVNVLFGQQYIYLQKNNDPPHTRIGINEMVHFKTDSSEWISGRLQGIYTETIVVSGRQYFLGDITAFRTYNSLVRVGGAALIGGGAMFTLIPIINRGINSETPLIRERGLLIGAGAVGLGFLVRWLARKTYLRDGGWRWEVIILDE